MEGHKNETRIRVRSVPWYGDEIEMLIGTGPACSGIEAIAGPLVFTPLRPGQVPDSPTLRIEQEEAQRVMDQLWDCGLRPTQGKGSAGQLSAVQKHLEDFREIVFNRSPHLKPVKT